MRKQFTITIESIMQKDDRVIVLLGDIGVFGFKKCFDLFPERIFNIGVLEQSSISLAAGLAKVGLIPTFYSIAPFVVERAFEQIKLDFGYQSLGGNFVSVGASYDYASLGPTHHCPADIGILSYIPDMQITVPGTSDELDTLYRYSYGNGKPTYFRLSEKGNKKSQTTMFGKGNLIKHGNLATVIAVGPMLDPVIEASEDLDVCILYYNTISPFDSALLECAKNNKFIICEPYYSSRITHDIIQHYEYKSLQIKNISMPVNFIRTNGSVEDHDMSFGFDRLSIRETIKRVIRQ